MMGSEWPNLHSLQHSTNNWPAFVKQAAIGPENWPESRNLGGIPLPAGALAKSLSCISAVASVLAST